MSNAGLIILDIITGIAATGNFIMFFLNRSVMRQYAAEVAAAKEKLHQAAEQLMPEYINLLQDLAVRVCPFCAVADTDFKEKMNLEGVVGLVTKSGKMVEFKLSEISVHEELNGEHEIDAPDGHTTANCVANGIRKRAKEMFKESMKGAYDKN